MGKVGGTYFLLQNLLVYFDDALRKLMKVTFVSPNTTSTYW
jgi:hypothetical protein